MKDWLKKRWQLLLAVLIVLPLLTFAGLFLIGIFNVFHAHEHCSKVASSAFSMYASDHEGRYPFHTNGFGDALLLLVKEGQLPDPRWITAPGDDGKVYKDCLQKGSNVPEEKCTRIYIQGLSETNAYDDVVMMFDKYPTPGGDHFRRPWGTPIRDVVMSDGRVQFISEERWPTFASEQIERLVKLGFQRQELEKLFNVQSRGISGFPSPPN
jgi:hypothetical protein